MQTTVESGHERTFRPHGHQSSQSMFVDIPKLNSNDDSHFVARFKNQRVAYQADLKEVLLQFAIDLVLWSAS